VDPNKVKINLKKYYNQEAELRNLSEKQEWKIQQRSRFCSYVKSENKNSLLEIGAGTGNDSRFFMDCGFTVVAIDLSNEMVKLCKGKNIEAYEMDFYNISSLNKKFDCIWSMNSLLHVPKADLLQVLNEIDSVLNEKGLFYMGVYGGVDTENEYVNEVTDTPRFFSYYSESRIKEVLSSVFDIIEFEQIDVARDIDFQAIIMRKK
jgi:cyclopropane fatty-acyl-phospholipid synthase-like methyltransferase